MYRFILAGVALFVLAFAPAPLPKRTKPGPWPVGLWVSDQNVRNTLRINPDGTARETWMSSEVHGTWRIDHRDGSVLCFSNQGGWMGVWHPVTYKTLHSGYTGGVCYRRVD